VPPSEPAAPLEVRVGLCGFTIGFDDYLERFPVVEVQQTFYEPPQDATMRRWRDRAPAPFEFTLKAWQVITHEGSSPTYRRMKRPLGDPAEAGSFRTNATTLAAWQRTLECVRLLWATAVLLQCPRSFRPTDENVERMRTFLTTVDRPDGVRLLWEPRGPWPADLVRDLCAGLDLVHVVDPFADTTLTPEHTYFRLHGITGAHHVYSDDELVRLRGMLPDRGTAYVMFNELPRVGDATRFLQLLR
jgi:uncharacterized protein YecE (DUF72 family)